MNLSLKQKIHLFADYAMGLSKKDYSELEVKIYNRFHTAVEYKAFAFAVNLSDFNGFPRIVGNAEYKELPQQQVYRGVESPDHVAQLLVDWDYHHGDGFRFSGLYCSADEHVVRRDYTNEEKLENMLRFKISDDAKAITSRELASLTDALMSGNKEGQPKELVEIIDAFNELDDEKRFVAKCIIGNAPSILAVFLGYDVIAISRPKLAVQNNFAILNRDKIIVSQREFNRVCKASKLYEDGRVDLDKKSDADMLME